MHAYLPEAVQSLSSSYGLGNEFRLECIVVDDGSDAGLEDEVLNRDCPEGMEFRTLRISHRGKSAAVNKGLEMATGDYIAILDADDKLPGQSLFHRFKRARSTQSDIVLGGFETFDESGTVHYRQPPAFEDPEELVRKILVNIKSPVHLNAMLIKRSLINRVGNFDEELLRGQDKDYAIRLLKHANSVEVLNEAVYSYRRYARGFRTQVRNRLLTMKGKSRIMNKHSGGVQRVMYQCWSWSIEVLKLFYETVFGVYKK